LKFLDTLNFYRSKIGRTEVEQPLENQWAQIIALGHEYFMDIDYNENDHPTLPPLSDIIKSYSEARRLQEENEPTVAIGGDPIEDTDFPQANPLKNPAIMSPVNNLNPANGNIFSRPYQFLSSKPNSIFRGSQ
jgi:hypothetical protein